MGEECEEFAFLEYLYSGITSNLWLLIVVVISLFLIILLLVVYLIVVIRKRELKQDLERITEKKDEIKELHETFIMIEELIAKLKLNNDKNIQRFVSQFEKILKKKIIDTQQEKKSWKLIVKILGAISQLHEELKEEIESEMLYFTQKSINKTIEIKKIQHKVFGKYSKLILSAPTLAKNEVFECIEVSQKLNTFAKKIENLQKEEKIIVKKMVDVSNSLEEEVKENKKVLFSDSDVTVIKSYIQSLPKKQAQKYAGILSKLETENTEVTIEMEKLPSVEKKSKYDVSKIAVNVKQVKLNSRNKYKTLQLQKRESVQIECEELLDKIGDSIRKNKDSEVGYWSEGLFNKIVLNYYDIPGPFKILKKIKGILLLVLETNENNIDDVVLNVVKLTHYFCQIAYFNQKQDKIRMSLDEKNSLQVAVVEVNEKFNFNHLVTFHCVLIKECLLLIEDTGSFFNLFLSSINLLQPKGFISLLVSTWSKFQSQISVVNSKPFYTELLKMELFFQLNPIDFERFLEFEYKNYFLQLFKVEIITRICLQLVGSENVSDLIPDLVPGKKVFCLNILKTLEDLENDKKKKILKGNEAKEEEIDESKEDTATTELIRIEESEEIDEEGTMVVSKPRRQSENENFVKFQAVNFVLCWNKLQEIVVSRKNISAEIREKSIKNTSFICSKNQNSISWGYLKNLFSKKNKTLVDYINKLEVTMNQYYLYEKYLIRIVCDVKFLELSLPIVKEQYTSFSEQYKNDVMDIQMFYRYLEDNSRVVLTGVGGSGKSCLAMHLGYVFYYSSNLFSFFIGAPVFSKFYKKWKNGLVEEKTEILIEVIVESIESKFMQAFSSIEMISLKNQMKEIVSKHRIVLLIDAFDEISVADRVNFLNLLNVLSQEEDLNITKIVMTSRPDILTQYHHYLQHFKQININPLTEENSKKLVTSILKYNNKEKEEEEKIMKRFLLLAQKRGAGRNKEGSFPLISVLLLRRILNTDVEDDDEIKNNNFVLYESLITGSVVHDIEKYAHVKNSIAHCSVFWILNLISIIGYLNQRLKNPTKDKIIHILNQNFTEVVGNESWIVMEKNPIYSVVKSVVSICGILTQNKNFIIFSHRTLQSWAAARFILNPDRNSGIKSLIEKFNSNSGLNFSFFFKEEKWKNVYFFYFSYLDNKLTTLNPKIIKIFRRYGSTITKESYIKVLKKMIKLLNNKSVHRKSELNKIYGNVMLLGRYLNVREILVLLQEICQCTKNICYLGNYFSSCSLGKFQLPSGFSFMQKKVTGNCVLNGKIMTISVNRESRNNDIVQFCINKDGFGRFSTLMKNLRNIDNRAVHCFKSLGRNLLMIDRVIYELKESGHEEFYDLSEECTLVEEIVVSKNEKVMFLYSMYYGQNEPMHVKRFDLENKKMMDSVPMPPEFKQIDNFSMINDEVMLVQSGNVIKIIQISKNFIIKELSKIDMTQYSKGRIIHQNYTRNVIIIMDNTLVFFEIVDSQLREVNKYFHHSGIHHLKFLGEHGLRDHIIAVDSYKNVLVLSMKTLELIKTVHFSFIEVINDSFKRMINSRRMQTFVTVHNGVNELRGVFWNYNENFTQSFPILKFGDDVVDSPEEFDIDPEKTHVMNINELEFFDKTSFKFTRDSNISNYLITSDSEKGTSLLLEKNKDRFILSSYKIDSKQDIRFEKVVLEDDKKIVIEDDLDLDFCRLFDLKKYGILIVQKNESAVYNKKGEYIKKLPLFPNGIGEEDFKKHHLSATCYESKLYIIFKKKFIVYDMEKFEEVIDGEASEELVTIKVFSEKEVFVKNRFSYLFRVSIDTSVKPATVQFKRVLASSRTSFREFEKFSEELLLFSNARGLTKLTILNINTEKVTDISFPEKMFTFTYIQNTDFIVHYNKVYQIQGNKGVLIHEFDPEVTTKRPRWERVSNNIFRIIPKHIYNLCYDHFSFNEVIFIRFEHEVFQKCLDFKGLSVICPSDEEVRKCQNWYKNEELSMIQLQRKMEKHLEEIRNSKELLENIIKNKEQF